MRKGGGTDKEVKKLKVAFYNLSNAPKNIPPSIKPVAPYVVGETSCSSGNGCSVFFLLNFFLLFYQPYLHLVRFGDVFQDAPFDRS
jgi:hypothetical protein